MLLLIYLTATNLTVSGISTFNGNVDLGNATSDTVTFTARVDSNILPSTNGTLNLGGTSNKWNNIYANSFVGAITGNADTASQVSTGTTTGTGTYYPTFVDSNNLTRGNEFLYTDAGISYSAAANLLKSN
jgi:inosine-uridine nucleoside N-ribohydrolase